MTPIRILLVDDHTILRQGLQQLLESDPQMQVAGSAENGEVAIALAFSLKPDVILMDINLPQITGFEATRAILTAWPSAKILVLTNQDSPDIIRKFLDAGVKGFLLKDIPIETLHEAIRTVVRGESVPLSAELEEKLRQARPLPKEGGVFALTEREKEVLKALSKGYSNQQLAELLCVSPKTVHNHLYSIYSKIGVANRSEAILWALQSGFTS